MLLLLLSWSIANVLTQLRQRLLEIQDESDDLRRDRDRLLKDCERLQAELHAARRGRVPTEEIPMDIDDEEAQEAAANSSQDIPQPQSNVVPLRRTPTFVPPLTSLVVHALTPFPTGWITLTQSPHPGDTAPTPASTCLHRPRPKSGRANVSREMVLVLNSRSKTTGCPWMRLTFLGRVSFLI